MKVHYWELSNYNNGKLIGQWFDLESTTKEQHAEEIDGWLKELTQETGELCEEIIVGDTEEVPDQYVGTWQIYSEFFDFQEAVEDSGLDAEIIEAGASLGIPLDKIADAYQGHYDSDKELAEEQCYDDLESKIGSMVNYIDFEHLGRELAMDYSESDGHYFLA